ncbi:MAG: ATP-binding protein [Chloroflexi bacterium]|nr:ATP-binding protein [Chloroflexota bacterium]
MERPPHFICIQLPANPEYVLIVRLAVSGLANRLDFPYEEIEDIKLAVSEACNSIIAGSPPGSLILVECDSDGKTFEILVKTQSVDENDGALVPGSEQDMGLHIIRALMDDMEYLAKPGSGAVIRIRKNMSA